jgi:hypothetical protein
VVARAQKAGSVASRGLQEFLNGPDVICNSGLHGRGNTERLMYAAEIKERHVQVNRGVQVFQRLAETKTKPRKTAQVCPYKRTKWDEAISDAKRRIKALESTIAFYKQRKKAGDPWPAVSTVQAIDT